MAFRYRLTLPFLLWSLFKWGTHFLVYTAGFIALGALLGALLFPLAGLLLGMDLTISQMIVNGARDGGFYFCMWGPGLAFLYTVMQVHDDWTGRTTIPWKKKQSS